MTEQTEVTEIDGQMAILNRLFAGSVDVGPGDKLNLTFEDVVYEYAVTGPAVIVGCRNDGHPVECRNGSLISSNNVRLTKKGPPSSGRYIL